MCAIMMSKMIQEQDLADTNSCSLLEGDPSESCMVSYFQGFQMFQMVFGAGRSKQLMMVMEVRGHRGLRHEFRIQETQL